VIKNHEKVLLALYKTTKNSVEFEKIYKEFEVKYRICHFVRKASVTGKYLASINISRIESLQIALMFTPACF
jgi:hypothetical protein